MKISILGLGYVGFPVLMELNELGTHEVIGIDPNKAIIKKIQKRELHLVDESVEKRLKETSREFNVSINFDDMKDSDVYIICVPTPVNKDYDPDYSYVISAAQSVAKHLKKGDIVIVESTVNPGTCEEIVAPAIAKATKLKMGKDYDIVHVPERINPGDTKWDVTNLPRNIGGSRIEASERIRDLYGEFIDAELKVVSSLKVAESSKIVENSFRDLNIAFVNELAKSFDVMEINLIETIEAASTKPFAFMPHWPGPGVGGHCIAVDPYYLIRRAAKSGFNHRLLKEARNINNSMPEYTVQKLMLALNEIGLSVKESKIAILGLSYKGNVGDTRESPSFEIISRLEKLGAKLNIFDPYVPGMSNVETLEQALNGSDAAVLLTNHNEFKELSAKDMSKAGTKIIVDTKHMLDAKKIKDAGILFRGIGK